MTDTTADPALCLIAEAHPDAAWVARVAAALDATRAVTLILAPPAGRAAEPSALGPLVAMAGARKVAVLVADDVAAAKASRADGVHLSWRPEIEDAYAAARAALGSSAIVGAEAGSSRHDAMTLGEAGADYVAFAPMLDQAASADAAREAQSHLVAWWAEVFVIPVIAFDAGSADAVAGFIDDGADFVAVRLDRSAPESGDAAWAASLVAALDAPADAA
ncbi:MAG: thiamine phosphate synthase [Hyphomicrobium sp.]|uniref:thiamine phosphate synthase n=1 Tax=Hyphomicrobium sp. TaxID=82 RepID=UPI003D13C61C